MATHASSLNDGTISEIKKIGEAWVQAEIDRDTSALNRILRDDYSFVGHTGKVTLKQEWLDRLREVRFDLFKTSDVEVRLYENVAVVTGRATIRATSAGHEVDGDFRYTDVFVRDHNSWRAVASQVTRISKE